MSTDSLRWMIGGVTIRVRASGRTLMGPFWRTVFPDYVVDRGGRRAAQIELVVDPVDPRETLVDVGPTEKWTGIAEALSEGTFGYRHVDLVGELTDTPQGAQGRFSVREELPAISRMVLLALAQTGPRLGRLLLHASAVVQGGRGFVFAGDSGVGKTTIATELQGGGQTLSVDRTLLVRDASGRWLAYATPFSDGVRSGLAGEGVPVEALLFVEQAPEHRLRCLAPAAAVRQILKNTTCLARSREGDMLVLEVAGQLAETVSCCALQFSRDDGFWELLSALPNGATNAR